MLFCAILLSLYAATAHSQDVVCGYGLGGDGLGGDMVTVMSAHPPAEIDFFRGATSHPVKVLPLVGKLSDANLLYDVKHDVLRGREGKNGPRVSTKKLFDPDHQGSFSHFFKVMSKEMLSIEAPNHETVVEEVYEPIKGMAEYFGHPAGTAIATLTKADCATTSWSLGAWHAAVRAFALDVIEAADADINFNDYDGNNDGYVDLVAVLTPYNFGKLCGAHGTVFYDINTTFDGKIVDTIITGDQSASFNSIVGILAHEYGHVMDLPELYDRTDIGSSTAYAQHSAGIGEYGVMGGGSDGYVAEEVAEGGIPDGPTPLSAWSRIEVGWITPTEVTEDTDAPLEIHDIESDDGNVIKIPFPTELSKPDEYFLLSNRQIGNYYNDPLPQSGLLIWHIDDSVTGLDRNINEEHKAVDVECADGLRYDNPTTPVIDFTDDPAKGGDDLDYYTANDDYRTSHGGNIGDATDVWDGSTYTEFTPDSDPSTDGYDDMGTSGYSDDEQTEFTGIAVREITQNNRLSAAGNGHLSGRRKRRRHRPQAGPKRLDRGGDRPAVKPTWFRLALHTRRMR